MKTEEDKNLFLKKTINLSTLKLRSIVDSVNETLARANTNWRNGCYDHLTDASKLKIKVKLWEMDAARVHAICAIEYLDPKLGAEIKKKESEDKIKFCPVCDMLTKKQEG